MSLGQCERGTSFADVPDLSRAIELYQQLVEHDPLGTVERVSHLRALAGTRYERFRRTNTHSDLDGAIDTGERVVVEHHDEASDRSLDLRNLALALWDRWQATGEPGDRERAIERYRQAIAAAPIGHPDRPMYLVELSDLAWYGYGPTSGEAGLDEVISLTEQAMAETPIDAPNRPDILYKLGTQLIQRQAWRHDGEDLERAIELLTEALACVPADAPERAPYAGALSSALLRRFALNHDAADLAVATRELEQTLPLVDDLSPDAEILRIDLADAYLTLFWVNDQRRDLDRAIEVLEETLARFDHDSPNRDSVEGMLALATRDRHRETADLGDLRRAISLFERLATNTPENSSEWAGRWTNLAHTLQDRAKEERRDDDRDRALKILERVVARMPPDSPDRPEVLDNLASALFDRYLQIGTQDDLRRSIDLLEEAWRRLRQTFFALPVPYKLGQQRLWVTLYARLVSELLAWGETAPERSREARQRAMVVAESGKSRVLTDLIGRGDLPAPPAVEVLVPRERELMALLMAMDSQALATSDSHPVPAPAAATDGRTRRAYMVELARLWASMEQLGADAAEYVSLRRGDAPTWEDLTRIAADAGPETALLSIFLTADTTVMFVLRTGWDAPEVITADVAPSGWADAQRRMYREVARSSGRDSLATTWQTRLTAPMRDVARHVAGIDRVLVAPMGAAHLMPWQLLAEIGGWQGAHGDPPAVVAIPTLGLMPRLARAPARSTGTALVVGNPLGDLHHAEDEARQVAGVLGCEPLIGAEATLTRVRDGLADAPLAHLATHAAFSNSSALDSGIVLADGVLTARAIMAQRLRLDLMILSACESGVVDVQVGDELAGLMQAFLLAGAKSMVVSLWAVDDAATAALMTEFHDLNRAVDSPAALRGAVSRVRSQPMWIHPYYWAAFTIVGHA